MSDPTIVSLELLTVPSNGTLTLLLIYAILTDRPWRYLVPPGCLSVCLYYIILYFCRHFVQVVVNVCELYGGEGLILWLHHLLYNKVWVGTRLMYWRWFCRLKGLAY